MADVLTWLFNDGSSSKAGPEAETMSLASLQVRNNVWINVSRRGIAGYPFA